MIAHLLTMCLTVYFKPIGETLHRKKKIPFKTWLLIDNAPGHIRSLLEAGCWWWFSCSVVSDSGDPWTIAPQSPLSMGFSRQEYWSGLPFPSPGDHPNPGIKPGSSTLKANSLPSEPPGKPQKEEMRTKNMAVSPLWGRKKKILGDS